METMTYEEITEQLKDVFGAVWNNFRFDEKVAAIAYATLKQTTDKEKVEAFVRCTSYQLYDGCYSIEEVADEYLEDLGAFDNIDRKYVDIAWFAADFGSERRYIEVEYEDGDDHFYGYVVWE